MPGRIYNYPWFVSFQQNSAEPLPKSSFTKHESNEGFDVMVNDMYTHTEEFGTD